MRKSSSHRKSHRKSTKGEKGMTDQEKKIAKHAKAKREEAERRRKGKFTLHKDNHLLICTLILCSWGTRFLTCPSLS
jgi:hypothetical protein